MKPMLAKTGQKKDLERSDLFFEPKLDGFRAISDINKKVELYSRTKHSLTKQFPELDFRKQIKAQSCILDGEIVAYNKKGNPDFTLIQGRDQLTSTKEIQQRAQKNPATYIVFDILQKNGKSLLKKPLSERKKILEKTVKEGNNIKVIPYTTDGKKLWRLMEKRNQEGVVAKKKKSTYSPGKRSSVWLKIKFFKSIDCIIIGYTQEKRLISALALAVFEKGKLKYIGKVGTGFSEDEIKKLHDKLKKIKTKKSPVKEVTLKNVQWVKPKLVCEIKYFEITKDKKLRKPVYLRLRTDKPAKECVFK